MLTKTVEFQGVKFTVKTETGRDVLKKELLYPKFLGGDELDWQGSFQFIRALTQSSDVETPFLWPDITDSVDDLKKARDCFLDLPGAVFKAWLSALIEVDTPPGDKDLIPDTNPKNE